MTNVKRTSTPRAVLAGALGGLAGTLAMNYAQRLWTHAVDGEPPESPAGKHDARDWQEREEGRNANELFADSIATITIGRRLTESELEVAAPTVHHTFGAMLGAIYGYTVRERRKRLFGMGAAFGAVAWLFADEVAMPLMGLSRPTTERTPEKHLQSFVSHVVFGTVAEAVRRMTMPANFERGPLQLTLPGWRASREL